MSNFNRRKAWRDLDQEISILPYITLGITLYNTRYLTHAMKNETE